LTVAVSALNMDSMNGLFVSTVVIALFAACAAPHKAPVNSGDAPSNVDEPSGGGSDTDCDLHDCGRNGTALTGLRDDRQLGTVRTVALPTGETIVVR